MSEPCDTPRRSLVHDQWRRTFEALYDKEGDGTAVGELSYFAAKVLELCGDSEELAAFLDYRAIKAFEAVDG